MIYSRKIEIFKCMYAHFAHIHSSFGCTDEKMEISLYLDTYGHFLKNAPKSIISELKCYNMSGNVFRISTNPDMGKVENRKHQVFDPLTLISIAG